MMESQTLLLTLLSVKVSMARPWTAGPHEPQCVPSD